MTHEVEKPEVLEEAHLQFLDSLRDSGVTNMFGAAPYLERDFNLGRHESRKVLQYWMMTFDERHPAH